MAGVPYNSTPGIAALLEAGPWEAANLLPIETNRATGQRRMAVPKGIWDALILAGAPQKAVTGGYQLMVDPNTGENYYDGMAGDAVGLAAALTLGAGALPAESGALRMGLKAYHGSHDQFDNYDWSRLGDSTKENVAGLGVEEWATNLARLGPWSHERPLSKAKTGFAHSLPVDVGGKGKSFASLDALERFIRKSGGADPARQKLLAAGFGHVKVVDEEFGGNSYVSLSPDTFTVEGSK